MRNYHFFIPHRLPGLNEHDKASRTNRFIAAKLKKEYTELVRLLCQQALMKRTLEVMDKPVFIRFHWREPNNRRDPDNIVFAKKYILDGMVAVKIIPNDNMKYITGFSDHWEVVGSRGEGVMVEVVPGNVKEAVCLPSSNPRTN